MNNPDRFQIITGLIFSQLYERLPWRISLDFEEICDVFVTREDNNIIPWQDIFCATIQWLSEEGYISSDWEAAKDLCYKIQLPAKSLCSMMAFATTTDPKLVGDALVEAADSGNLEKLRIYGRAALMAASKAS